MMARALIALLLLTASRAAGYSVLSHEALVDAAWDRHIQPLILKRFPGTDPAVLLKSRAYAYGGCIIQDMGYYPFGSKLFSDLLHYARSGDFVTRLLVDAEDPNGYAFALGALAHYFADNYGHPLGTNRAMAVIYPKLRAKYGDVIPYEDEPVDHLRAEFAFDVLQVSQGLYAPQALHSFIGFEVDKPLLQRAFQETYGFEMKDIFSNLDLALGTYRHTVAGLIPKMTKVALATREKEMEKAATFNRRNFLYRYSERQYRREYGSSYSRPKWSDRFLAFLISILPKVGPLRALAVPKLTPQVDKLFLDSFQQSLLHYREGITEASDNNLQLADTNLDTGKPTKPDTYHLADHAYEKWAQEVAKHTPNPPAEIKSDILAYFASYTPKFKKKDDEKDWEKTQQALAVLKSPPSQPAASPSSASVQ